MLPAAGISHGRAQTARELMQYRHQAALVRHAALDALGHQLLELRGRILKIAVAGPVRLRHGAQRAHAAIGLVRSALVQLHLAGRLLGAGEHAADHDAVRAGGQRLGDVARVADAAVGDDRDAACPRAPWRRGRWR